MGNQHIKVLTLFPEEQAEAMKEWKLDNFSANNAFEDSERKKLEEKYWPITEVTDKFDRKAVSYQLSKNECLHRWLKYKEGFSSKLVQILLDEFGIKSGELVLDPFMGSGTTALVCAIQGINSIGYDILPMSKLSILAKTSVFKYDITELERILEEIKNLTVPEDYNGTTPSLTITEGAFPEKEDRTIAYYTEYFDNSDYSEIAKNLIKLCILNTLERVSYTIKSGQYLSWDHRCPKTIALNEARIAAGKRPFVTKKDKGEIPPFKETLIVEFTQILEDIKTLQKKKGEITADCTFIEGSVLYEIAKIPSDTVSGVITSPPYCNRYDYTRTYALELAYLGKSNEDVKKLRQQLLSCTVESKTKLESLKEHYASIGRLEDYNKIVEIIKGNKVLNEINEALKGRNVNGEINNKGILTMVDGYFTELTFLFYEIFRICKKGSHIAFVNDNVRYAGEVIPVDFLSTELAREIGFTPVKVYTLKQKKGNSSQQMAKYGRVAIRKSITVWRKD